MILWHRSFKNCTADSLIGPKVSKENGWNTYDPDNAAYLACFLDAAISAAASAEDAEAEMYESASVVATAVVTSHRQISLPGYQRQTIRAIAVTTKETRRFLP